MPRSPRQSTNADPSSARWLMPPARGAVVDEMVLLRHPVESDRAEWLKLRRENREYLERWEPLPPPGTTWGEDASFDRFLHSAVGDDRRRYLACLTDSGAIFGQFSLANIIRGPLQQCFLGYWIAERYSGRGLATRAMRLALRLAFEDLRLHRVEANIQPHNQRSRKLAARCGLRLEGFSPRYLEIAGGWADHERWAITREEFSSRA